MKYEELRQAAIVCDECGGTRGICVGGMDGPCSTCNSSGDYVELDDEAVRRLNILSHGVLTLLDENAALREAINDVIEGTKPAAYAPLTLREVHDWLSETQALSDAE